MNALVTTMSKVLALSPLAVALLAQASAQAPAFGDGPPLPRAVVFDPDFTAAMATLPVQEGGRIKPLSALAATALHLTHGRRDMKLDTDGDRKPDVTMTPTEWLLAVWCDPRAAVDYPLFRIENVDVLDAIGVPHEGGQRFDFDYISYHQLLGNADGGAAPIQTLFTLFDRYRTKSGKDQTPVESHIVRTAEGVDEFSALHSLLEPLQVPWRVEGDRLRALFGGRDHIGIADLLAHGHEFADLILEYKDNPSDPALGNAMGLASMLQSLSQQRQAGPALFPPDEADKAAWLSLGDLVGRSLRGELSPTLLGMVTHLQAALDATAPADRDRELLAFRGAVVDRARARGEYGMVPLEDYYLAAAWHYKGLHWFLLAILVVAAGWFAPRSKWLWLTGLLMTFVPWAFLVTDIVLRCVIQGRPPILRLYDTFLFIGAVGVLAALVAEIVTRRRVALAMGPIFGALMVALARAFELGDGKDQMAPLQAVLDTNYYLAIHVTSINMGYAAGMLAAFLGTAWLVLNALGFRRNDQVFHKSIVRATYGVVAFGLIFAVFGTIYGGVWANDSWGRFWGWDPKENGALLICLAQVALLHARMCGWVRDLGFCVAAALTGLVVAFSWFHVNLLEIGLHAYGFSSKTKTALFTYYYAQLGITALALVGTLWQRSRVPAPAPVPA